MVDQLPMTIPKINLREPKTLVRVGLGLLLLANLIAAVFAFHLIGDSPGGSGCAAGGRAAQIVHSAPLSCTSTKSKRSPHNMDLSREQGDKFLATYMTTPPRIPFPTIDRRDQ